MSPTSSRNSVPPAAFSGTVDGHAAFEFDWETVPYCSGPMDALLHHDGRLELTGSCSIVWGPFYGETFGVRGAGTVDSDDAVRADLAFDYASTERDFSDLTVTGTLDQGIEARGETRYLSEVGGGLDIEAFVVVRLGRVE